MTLHIPTVTESDLLAFHTTRFGFPFPHSNLMPASYHAPVEEEEEEEAYDPDPDNLGYYPDGAKRTLTDSQIAMFRHTEIQTLLREKRQREEAEEENRARSQTRAPSRPGSHTGAGNTKQRHRAPTGANRDSSDEEEYTRFLTAERAEFQKAAALRRNGEREELGYERGDRTISTRRRVRELDSVGGRGHVDVLMYDDGPAETAAVRATGGGEKREEGKAEGRKIWFPMIG